MSKAARLNPRIPRAGARRVRNRTPLQIEFSGQGRLRPCAADRAPARVRDSRPTWRIRRGRCPSSSRWGGGRRSAGSVPGAPGWCSGTAGPRMYSQSPAPLSNSANLAGDAQAQQSLRGDGGRRAVHRLVVVEAGRPGCARQSPSCARPGAPVSQYGMPSDGVCGDIEIAGGRARPLRKMAARPERRQAGQSRNSSCSAKPHMAQASPRVQVVNGE